MEKNVDEGNDTGRDSKQTSGTERISRYDRPAKVICSNMVCEERGDRARCYLDIYRNCEIYQRASLDDKKDKTETFK